MKHSDYLKKKKTRETRKKIISVISAIVVFVTTYALVLPAITLDVSKASQEPGIAFEQMQFKATAAAASVTAADSTVEVQVEEAQVEETEAEAPAEETIQEEPAESSEEEASAVSDEQEEIPAEPEQVETPAEPEQEEAPAAEAETKEVQADKSADSSSETASSPETDASEAQTADTQKSTDQAAVDQSGTEITDAAAAATTAEAAAEFQIPALDALDFDDILTDSTAFYYYHPENAEEAESLSSDSVDDWKKAGSDTVLAPKDFVRVYLSYEIQAGALNETNTEARYRLPAGLELSDKQIEAINKYENGIAASKSGSERDKYLGAEAIEGSRTPDEKAGDEYISATVKVEKTNDDRQELVFTFIPYTVEKNQVSYDEKGEVKSKGKEVKGFFSFDLKTSQIDFEKTSIETVEKEDGTTEEIQYSESKVDFTKDIDRTLKLAGPVTKEETRTAEPQTLTSEGADYTVTVSYTDEAQIPDNAELTVREIEKDTEEYASYLKQAKGAVDETKSVNEARFFDITILADGEKVEPKAPVSVQINFAGIEQTSTDDTQLLHYKESDEVEVMDQAEFSKSEEQTVDTVQFETDGFSVYGIVSTELVTEFTISNPDGEDVTYLVTVTYGPEANIPEGSTLRVAPFAEGSEDYVNARNAVLADKKAKDEPVDIDDFNLAALDISIIDPNGQEIEPEAAVTVDIKIKDLPGVENLDEVKDTLEIQHHVEVPDGVVVEKVFDGSVEGSYKMDTDENIAKEGTAVDPSSVSDDDFRNIETTEDDSVDASFDTEVFSTFTITWRTGYNARTVTVHYVDESGNELPIANPDNTHPNLNAQSSNPAFLIYDIDGYEYAYTYRNTNTSANRIAPLLAKNTSNYWMYNVTRRTYQNGAFRDFTGTELLNGDNIYVVYRKKADPTTGGTPEIDDASSEDWPQDPATPQFTKTSIHNKDGVTNTVSLSISGGEKEYEKSTKANVIVVFDRSGSMGGDNIWRLNTAKSAVNGMANTLLNGDIEGVKMALVSFSTTAGTVQGFTDNYTTYTSAVNGLTADGGTNWEQALSVANRMAVDSDAATFIVFVTDGDPTFRMSRGDVTNDNLDMWTGSTYEYYRDNRVFGQGNADSQGRNFDYAAEEVSSILANNKTFYAIGVSSDVTKVQNLVDEAGGGTAYLATDSAALEEAFANITQSIKTTLGFGDVTITDGITELSNVEMKVMQEVNPDSFKYYKITSSGQTEWDPVSEGAQLATYNSDTGAVVWDMGDNFQLEDGVTYMVTFKVWPSQDAYNLIAELNNGVKVYREGQPNSITAEEREQVEELVAPSGTTQGKYTLKTNTDTVNATYSQTSSTGETVTVSGETGLTATYHEGTIENMPLESMKLKVKKVFEDDLTSGEDRDTEVTLVMKRRSGHQATASDEAFENYPVPQQDGTLKEEIVLNDANNWTYEVYVAPGLEAEGEVLEHGYDYKIAEPNIDYHYGLIEEIINPMVVDGQDKYYGDGYLIDDEAAIEEYTDQSLTAVNRVKSGVDIEKHVYDVDGTTEIYPDTDFTVTGYLLGPDGQPYTFNNSEWTRPDESSADGASPGWIEHQNDTGAYHKYDRNGNRTVYKGHFDNTGNISLTLKAGESVRFINVPDGCTFQFTESTDGMDALGYQWMSTDAITQHRTSPGGPFTPDEEDLQPDVDEQTVSLNGNKSVVGNKQYAITYSNKRTIALPDVELIKVDADDNTVKLNDAEFALHKDSIDGDLVTVDGNGNEIEIKTGNKTGSTGPDGWYHIGLLPAGTYYLVETAEPDNYLLDETPVIITVAKGTGSYTVTATKGGESVITGPTDGLYTITVDNKINLTEAEANKAWENADGTTTAPTGATVVFTLYADEEATEYKVTLDGAADEDVPETAGGYESEGWTAQFVNLPKYNLEGEEPAEIVYTIAETTTYPGYTPSTTNPVASGETITNKQEPTTAEATKAWVNADGSTTAPDGATVVFTLYADGSSTDYTVTLDGTSDEIVPSTTAGYEREAWKATFVNLPKYQAGTTTEIVYTIGETETYPGYTKSPENPVASGGTITNTQGSTDTYAMKAWKNADGSETAPEGASVVFTLYADGTATDYTVTLDGTVDETVPTGTGGYESEAWTATFVNLPKYQKGTTTEIVYTIAETTGYPGYTASTTEPVGSGSTITNSQEATEANALKAWMNADGTTTAPQGGKVTYTLYADGTATDYTVTLDGTVDTAPEVTGGYESEAWKASFVNLPKYQTGTTTEIVYTIAETTTYPGYTASTTEPVGSGRTITNSQEATEANALKAWKNADGSTTPPAGATVEFTLYADGTATEYKVTLDGMADETIPTGTAGYESAAWKAMFQNLPKYKVVEGEAVEIVYTIGESQGYAGYTATPEVPVESGETITNTQDDVDAYATKIWANADGSSTAPENATVVFTLYADGTEKYTVTLDGTPETTVPTTTGGYESEAWKATFVHLPKYQADGTSEIRYTIAETTGYEGYEMDPTTPVESGGTITNRQIMTVIQIKKIGDWTETKTLSGVQFKLFSDETCTDQIMTDSTGVPFGTDGIITTGTDGTVTIGALIPGTYYLQEVATADGYNLLSDVVVFTIKTDGTIEYSTGNNNFDSTTHAFYELNDGGYGIYINNPSGYELPHTGGYGTFLYTLSGIALIIASALMYGFRMRRRERRLN